METVTKITPLALAFIMLGLGLGLSVKDFNRVIKTPNDVSYSVPTAAYALIMYITGLIFIYILRKSI
jgi:BASS family bile acid:Na+ symporter|tara:strand:+ start:370 stop:570 length:201 start_codon:yes stop_codon:yes gene_type:complete